MEEKSRGGEKGLGTTVQALKFHPGGGEGWTCREGGFSLSPRGLQANLHGPQVFWVRCFPKATDRQAGYRPDLNQVQRTLGHLALLHRPPDPVLHTRRVLLTLLPVAVLCPASGRCPAPCGQCAWCSAFLSAAYQCRESGLTFRQYLTVARPWPSTV